jgi:hypothetical protein
LRALFHQLRASQLKFERSLPHPKGEDQGKILSEVVITTSEGGRFYKLGDEAQIEREQFIKHI